MRLIETGLEADNGILTKLCLRLLGSHLPALSQRVLLVQALPRINHLIR